MPTSQKLTWNATKVRLSKLYMCCSFFSTCNSLPLKMDSVVLSHLVNKLLLYCYKLVSGYCNHATLNFILEVKVKLRSRSVNCSVSGLAIHAVKAPDINVHVSAASYDFHFMARSSLKLGILQTPLGSVQMFVPLIHSCVEWSNKILPFPCQQYATFPTGVRGCGHHFWRYMGRNISELSGATGWTPTKTTITREMVNIGTCINTPSPIICPLLLQFSICPSLTLA